MTSFNVAEAKKRFSSLLGRVALKHESFVITRRGVPMAKLVPVEPTMDRPHPLGDVDGWLDDDDPFFAAVDDLVAERRRHIPRVWRAVPEPEDEA